MIFPTERRNMMSMTVDRKMVESWSRELDAVSERIAHCSVRSEVRQRAHDYLRGLLSTAERKNGWQLAEVAGNATPYGIQHLLGRANWDADELRDDLREYVAEYLAGQEESVLAVDETGFIKKGTESVGVKRQYTGTVGKIENCQVGVFLAYAAPSFAGRAFIDRELYLPKEWAEDKGRREEAGVPEEVKFATKGKLAQRMLSDAFEAEVPAKWVTADEVYGNDGKLRRWLQERGKSYVMAVSRSHPLPSIFGCRRAEEVLAEAPEEVWARVMLGEGSKVVRVYDWARARLPYECPDGWVQWLLARRSVSNPQEIAYYRAYAPEEATLEELAKVAGSRWSIEECFERAKGEVGLDHYVG